MKILTTFFCKTRDLWLKLGIVSVGIFCSVLAFADSGDPTITGNNFGAVAVKLQGEAVSWKTGLWTFAQVGGIIIAIMGIMSWVKAAKGHTGHSHAKGMTMVAIGTCCFFLSTVMGGAASSIFGS